MATTNTSFGILFWLKLASAKNKKAPLYARITVNGKRAEISLKRKITITKWDSTKSKLKGTGEEPNLINNYLEQVHNKLFESYRKLVQENKLVSPQLVKVAFLGEDESRHKMSDIIEYHNEHMKSTLRWGTQKNYFTTHKYIYSFLKSKHKKDNIFLSELNYKFIIDFERYLRQQKSMGNNTVMKHIERLRKMVSLAFKMEWIDKDPFVKFTAKYERKERTFLTTKELSTIEEKHFSIRRLQLIKDLFIFSCYTGLSYKDVMNLTKENICLGIDKRLWIYTSRQKTNNSVKIPLLSKAISLIEKYENHPEAVKAKTLFPTISNQKLNSYLKEIADVCGIDKNLTFHIARHTFATTVTLSNGVPIETVSKLLGHSKITTTQIYARVVEQKISEDIQRLQAQF